MSGYPRLDETGLNTLAEALADATKQQGVIKVCETEAEWNQKTQAEKDDPNIYWFLPWRTSTSGEIDDSTTALDKVWSSQKVNSENTALKAMVTDDYVFSPSKAYVAGDWLIHNNILYEVLVACTGVTPPNATYYNPITLHELKNRIDALNSDITNLNTLANKQNHPIANRNCLSQNVYTTAGAHTISVKDQNGHVSTCFLVTIQSGSNEALFLGNLTAQHVLFVAGSDTIKNNVTMTYSSGNVTVTNTSSLTTIRVFVILF